MSNIDQFESIFKSSIKELFVYEQPVFKNVLIVTDLQNPEAELFTEKMINFLAGAGVDSTHLQYKTITAELFESSEDLLKIVESQKPDLICTYRNLHSEAWKFPHSLGEYIDVLLQKTSAAVLLVPHPKAGYAYDHAFDSMDNVMAITDHLSKDHRLVNCAAKFTKNDGTLHLAHIEDQVYFDRIIEAISKIPAIETEQAENLIKEKLLKEASDYISSCSKILKEHYPIKIHSIVKFAHFLKHYRDRIEKEKINLLVINTKDDDQLAMHGVAYPLAVELRQISLLML